MNTISGNEPIHPIIVRNNYTDINGDKMLADITYTGQTLYQEALLRFMCTLVQSNYNPRQLRQVDTEAITHKAEELTQAYINQLNKQP